MTNQSDIKVLENILKDFPLLLSRTINSRKMAERIVLYNQLDWVRDRIEIVKVSLEEKAPGTESNPCV